MTCKTMTWKIEKTWAALALPEPEAGIEFDSHLGFELQPHAPAARGPR